MAISNEKLHLAREIYEGILSSVEATGHPVDGDGYLPGFDRLDDVHDQMRALKIELVPADLRDELNLVGRQELMKNVRAYFPDALKKFSVKNYG